MEELLKDIADFLSIYQKVGTIILIDGSLYNQDGEGATTNDFCSTCTIASNIKVFNATEYIKIPKNKESYDNAIKNITEYSKVIGDLSEKVTITCPIHGDFDITPKNFLEAKYGCTKCY